MHFAVVAAAIAAAVTVLFSVGGPLSAQLGVLPPYTAFRLFALGSFAGSVAGLGFGLWSLVRTWNQPDAVGRPWAWCGVLVGAGVLLLMALSGASASKVPPIHDITTDPADPPAFVEALEAQGNRGRDLSYPHGDPRSAERQCKAYPDLAPIALPLPPPEALAKASKIASELGWTITAENPKTGRLEATETTRLFRFVDDVVVRVRLAPEGPGSVVDLRSTSRNGVSDLGANAERIRRFREALLAGEGLS
ncbi:MAG: DUF1499 domain-containing protein [Acidobacteria bacterium]|nr:DUF1499 domain-containing protein [Acidobacteriota bacterium]